MNEKRNEKWLDELISRTINTTKPEFDVEKWKQKYPEEFQILQSLSGQDSSRRQPSVWRIVRQSPITKLAAAAVIIVAIGFFIAHRGPREQEPVQIAKADKSPAELMTLMSLHFAYRQGGIEGVEEICDKAFKRVGPRPARVSIQELLEEFNGQDFERTKL